MVAHSIGEQTYFSRVMRESFMSRRAGALLARLGIATVPQAPTGRSPSPRHSIAYCRPGATSNTTLWRGFPCSRNRLRKPHQSFRQRCLCPHPSPTDASRPTWTSIRCYAMRMRDSTSTLFRAFQRVNALMRRTDVSDVRSALRTLSGDPASDEVAVLEDYLGGDHDEGIAFELTRDRVLPLGSSAYRKSVSVAPSAASSFACLHHEAE